MSEQGGKVGRQRKQEQVLKDTVPESSFQIVVIFLHLQVASSSLKKSRTNILCLGEQNSNQESWGKMLALDFSLLGNQLSLLPNYSSFACNRHARFMVALPCVDCLSLSADFPFVCVCAGVIPHIHKSLIGKKGSQKAA